MYCSVMLGASKMLTLLLHLILKNVTTSRPHSVFSCIACKPAPTDWLQASPFETYKLFTFTKATLKRKLGLTGVQISFGMWGGWVFCVQMWGGWMVFFLQTDPPHLICFAKCADIAIRVTHVGNLGVGGNVGNLQCMAMYPTAHTGAWQMVCTVKWHSQSFISNAPLVVTINNILTLQFKWQILCWVLLACGTPEMLQLVSTLFTKSVHLYKLVHKLQ